MRAAAMQSPVLLAPPFPLGAMLLWDRLPFLRACMNSSEISNTPVRSHEGVLIEYRAGGRSFWHRPREDSMRCNHAVRLYQAGQPVSAVSDAVRRDEPFGIKGLEVASARKGDTYMTGNVYSNIQFSNYVRAITKTECNGFAFPAGKLAATDLEYFLSVPQIGAWYKGFHARCPDVDTICYLIQDRVSRSRPRVLRGYFVTDTTGKELHRVALSNSRASWGVLTKAVRAITAQNVESTTPLLRFHEEHIDVFDEALLKSLQQDFPAQRFNLKPH